MRAGSRGLAADMSHSALSTQQQPRSKCLLDGPVGSPALGTHGAAAGKKTWVSGNDDSPSVLCALSHSMGMKSNLMVEPALETSEPTLKARTHWLSLSTRSAPVACT